MLRGYRRYIVAFVIVAVGLGVAFQKIDYWQRYQPPTEHPTKPAETSVINTARIADALDSMVADQKSADSSERARRDLDAQEGAARWTKWNAWSAIIQLIVSALGLSALIYTLRQTDIALKEARRANRITLIEAKRARREAKDAAIESARALEIAASNAHSARRAASAANESNNVARETMRRQLRAYVTLEPGGINEAQEALCRAPINIINNGQTPAYRLELNGDFVIFEGDPRQFDPAKHGRLGDETAATDAVLGPRSNRFTYAYLEANRCEPFWGKIAAKQAAIVHYGLLSYQDVFGETHHTAFAFYHWGDDLSDLKSKRCRFGNNAT
jgi:hypothetical protein